MRDHFTFRLERGSIEEMFCAILLVSMAPLPQGDPSPWTRLEEPVERSVRTSVREIGYGTLFVEDGKLLRHRGEISAVDSIEPGGHGSVLSLVPDPAGLTFLVTERGLFVVSPQVALTARVELSGDAPQGTLQSAFVDPARRVWLATDEAFGCIDPSFYRGRTIDVPARGPYELLAGDAHGVIIATADGAWRYAFDRGEEPRVDAVRLDGVLLGADAEISIDYREAIDLEVDGTATGGPTALYRVDLHHKWLPLDAGIDDEIRPGQHTLDVAVMDRDLRISAPFSMPLSVAYPYYYRQAFVLTVGALVTLAVFVAFLRAYSHATRSRPRATILNRSAVSTLLVVVLGLQILAGAVPHGRGWPFIGYSMYTESRDVGYMAYNGKLIGIEVGGWHRDIPIGALGVAADNRWQVLGPILRGGPEVSANAIAKYNADRPESQPIVGMQVWAERWLTTASGAVPIAQLILSDYRVPESER